MAAKKKSAAKLKSWTVTANGREIVVDAADFEVSEGCLVFTTSGSIVWAFSDGGWADVRVNVDAETP